MRIISLAEHRKQATHAIIRSAAWDSFAHLGETLIDLDDIHISAAVDAAADLSALVAGEFDWREESLTLVPAGLVPNPLVLEGEVVGRPQPGEPAAWVVVTELVNLTPHDVTIWDGDREVLAIPPSGTVARLAEEIRSRRTAAGIPIVEVGLGAAELPAPRPGVVHIVSRALAMTMRAWDQADRTSADLVYPYDQVRDSTGRVVGCRALATL